MSRWWRNRSTSRIYPLAAIITVLGLAAAGTLWARSHAGSLTPQSTSITQQNNSGGRPNQRGASPAPSSMTVETVTLTTRGFEPAEVTPSSDKFLLGIDNRLIVEELSFEILRENGQKVRQLKMEKNQVRLRKLINLQPGRYTLQVIDHPEWRCSIVVPN